MKKKLTKRVQKIREGLDLDKTYDVADAIALIKENSTAKFDETIEIIFNLNANPKYADQNVRSVVDLPNGTGKKVVVAVFARGEKADEAKEAGADIVGAEDLCEIIQSGKIDFDRTIATPDLMGVVGKVAKLLGPQGLMPNPKLGTVTVDVAKAVKSAKAGQVQYRADKFGIVHGLVGKASFEVEKIQENVKSFLSSLKQVKPTGIKGVYIKSVYLGSTMGLSLKINLSNLETA